MFILDLLDNLPQLRLSDDHLKVIIWAMNECGTPNVPSSTSLRAKQAQLTKEMEIKTTHHTSAQENVFYSNRPSETTQLVSRLLSLSDGVLLTLVMVMFVTQDFANPLVRPHMKLLPRVGVPISEFRDAGKWVEENDTSLEHAQQIVERSEIVVAVKAAKQTCEGTAEGVLLGTQESR